MFLFDEASGIPDIVFDVGALSTKGFKVVMADNRTNGFLTFTTSSRLGVSCMTSPGAGSTADLKCLVIDLEPTGRDKSVVNSQ